MKILQVITSMFTGGAEKLILEMAPLMQEQDNQVDVLLFNGTDTPFKQQLKDAGVHVICLSEGENASYYHPRFIWDLARILPRYDVVHAHNTACQYYVAAASCFCHKPRLVTTEHNTSNNHRKYAIFRLLDKWMYGRYDGVAAISETARRNLARYINCPVERIQLIHNGVNLKAMVSPTTLVLRQNPGQTVLVMAAAFRPQKDHLTAIRAMRLLPDSYHLFLAGEGELLGKYKRLVAEEGIGGKVSFLGMRSDIPAVLHASDVVILASHYEGLSLSSLEALASGRPLVASDVEGLREIVKDAGVLVPEADEKALADAVERLVADKEYYGQTVRSCKERAAQFDIAQTVQQYISLYNNSNNV